MKKLEIEKAEELKQFFNLQHSEKEFEILYRNKIVFFTNHIQSLYTEIKNIFEKEIYKINVSTCTPLIIDGGAHIGVSVVFFKQLYPDSKIFAFEPNSFSLKYLKMNLKINDLHNVTIIPRALYDKKTEVAFNALTDDSSSISNKGKTIVGTDTLSSYIRKYRTIDILKLNVEGMELKILKESARELKNIRNIIFEYHNFPEIENELHEILKILSENDFRYIIKTFDKETDPVAALPYTIDKDTKYFQLVYGKNVKFKSKKNIKTKRKDIVKNYRKASLLEKTFEYKKAKKAFCDLLNIIDEKKDKKLKAGIHFHIGCIERKLGNESSALTHFKECLRLEPEHKKADIYTKKPLLEGVKPVSTLYGADRGTPLDRYYIEKFIKNNKNLIKGNVLEILDSKYTRLFGGKKVYRSDVLDINRDNKLATIYADLRKKEELPKNRYDCIILTQTIHIIDDFFSVVEGVYGMLKKGGVVLATLPSVSRIDVSAGIDGDYWRFTKASAKYLFEKFFKSKNIEIKSYGNAFVCSSFLYGYSHEEIPLEYLEYNDENFPLLITVKAKK